MNIQFISDTHLAQEQRSTDYWAKTMSLFVKWREESDALVCAKKMNGGSSFFFFGDYNYSPRAHINDIDLSLSEDEDTYEEDEEEEERGEEEEDYDDDEEDDYDDDYEEDDDADDLAVIEIPALICKCQWNKHPLFCKCKG